MQRASLFYRWLVFYVMRAQSTISNIGTMLKFLPISDLAINEHSSLYTCRKRHGTRDCSARSLPAKCGEARTGAD
jgi:hypothetical protein